MNRSKMAVGLARAVAFVLLAGLNLEGEQSGLGPFAPAPERKPPSPASAATRQVEESRIRGSGERGRVRLLLVEQDGGLTRIVRRPGSRPAPGDGGWDKGDRISMRLSQASLVDFFRLLSRLTDLNLVIDPDVQGRITLTAQRVRTPNLLSAALEGHHLEKLEIGELIRIRKRRPPGPQETADGSRPDSPDSTTLIRRVGYSDVETLAKQVREHGSLLSERGRLVVDARTNTLLVTDSKEHLHRLDHFLETLDRPEPQVQIEARIVEATTGFAREIGAEFGFQVGTPDARTRAEARSQNTGSSSQGIITFLSGRLLDTFRLDAMLRAGIAEGRARMISKPKVTAQNNVRAVMTQGSKIPIPVQSNFSTRVRFETAALRLTVQPRISHRGTVLLKLKVEQNVPDFTRTVFGIPTILTSEADTVVLVPDGGTVVLGGILVETDRESETRVPGLGNIPFLAAAFRKISKQKETREILFFLTSTIQDLAVRGESPVGRLEGAPDAGAPGKVSGTPTKKKESKQEKTR